MERESKKTRWGLYKKHTILLSYLSLLITFLSNLGTVHADDISPSSTSNESSKINQVAPSSSQSSEVKGSSSKISSSESVKSDGSDDSASSEPSDISPRLSVSTMDVGTQTTASVANTNDLTNALNDSSVDTIYLTADLALGNGQFAVNRNITIEGNNHTITYGGTMSDTRGIYFNQDNITIHFKNIFFGRASDLGKNLSTNAGNYYGFSPGRNLSGNNSSRTLIIENVTYNSDRGAQPFYLKGKNDKIIFKGNNVFNMLGESDGNSQEFAEASNFVFEDNSTTTVTDKNQGASGFIWSDNAAPSITVGDNANFIVTTSRHDFIYAGGGVPVIKIGNNGTISFNQNTSDTRGSGKIIYQTLSPSITLGEGANLDLHSRYTSTFTDITVNMPKNSSAVFAAASGDSMKISGTGNFNISDAARLLIEGTSGNPITGKSNINFNSFGTNTLGYDSYINVPPSNSYANFLTQTQPGTWSGNSSDNGSNVTFSRTGDPNFTNSQLISLQNTTFMSFTRQTPVSLSWTSDGSDTSAKAVPLTTSTDNAADYTDTVYWNDPGRFNNLIFKLYDSDGVSQIGSDLANIASTPGHNDYTGIQFTIPSSYLPVKSVNKSFYIKAFKKNLDGSQTLMKTLPLNITVDGRVSLKNMPSNLSWTNRTIAQTKGILARDGGNTMSFEVKDTRINPTPWMLTAHVAGTAPFSLVWKDAAGDVPVNLEDVSVFTKDTVGIGTSTDANGSVTYSKSWAENSGVLLKSDDYLTIGSHNGLTISWNLVAAP
ncbi:hypothetical protein OZX60_06800 [Streptococcaceae bacterium ESL0687]|nr:hypothetical protein OZX60_06800 [Streptococcaceae bacterium ESL0687]